MHTRTPALWRIALIAGVAATAVGALGSWIPSFWGDEAASIMSATRTWPELWRMLQTVDGVHGVYYAFLHLWIGAFGASEFSVRLPSAIAAGFLAAGTTVLAGRLGGLRLALIAGLVAALLPRTVLMAAEARSYAIGSAIAVWLTVLLLALLERRRPWWAWAGYALGITLSIYVFLYLALLLAVHGLFILLFHRRRIGRWSTAAAVGLILALPLVRLASTERNQIGFLSGRDYITPLNVLALQWFDPITAWPCWALIAIGVVATVRGRARTDPRVTDGTGPVHDADRAHDAAPVHDAVPVHDPGHADDAGRTRLAALALIWLVLPTAAVLVASAVIAPMYTVRYLSFCTPAAAILIGIGVIAIARFLAVRIRMRASLLSGIALAVLLSAFLPNLVVERGPYAKDGSDWREAAAYLHAHARASDPVLYDDRPKDSEEPRLISAVYPAGVAGLRDPALITSFGVRTGLWDRTLPNDALTVRDLGSQVWAVERGPDAAHSPDVAHLQALGYRLVSAHRIHVTTVLHLVRP